LKNIVGYQEGAVVSRTLLDKKSGTVTLFAFDANQRLSEHTTPFEGLVYVLDGEVEATISGKSTWLVAGEFTVIPTKAPH
jgi:quercetin dioxygenase-like cupin family protein